MKMRLTVITEIIAPYRIPVFNALAARSDTELYVVFLAEGDATLRQWLIYKDEIRFSYEVLPSLRRRLGQQNLLLNWGMARALAASKPQVILCGGYNYLASWQAAYWAKRRRAPFLLWIESTAADHRTRLPLVEGLKRRFFRLCTAFVVPGKASSDYVRGFGVNDDRIFVAPNAIDITLFRDSAAQARKIAVQLRRELQLPERYFLNVGRLVPAKGVFDLLVAYAKLEASVRSEAGLVFVGDGAARDELVARARAISPGSVQFRGFVQRDQLPAYYALAEAMIFPTHSDTWGFVVNEAMACGVPVIAANVAGSVADLVEDSMTGFVVPAQDPIKLREAMARVASHPNLRSEIVERAQQRISQYTPEACAEGMAQAARSVLGTS